MPKIILKPFLTEAQYKYLRMLFNDLLFNEAQKKDFLQREFGVNFIYELKINQASELIEYLKKMKEKEKES